MVPLKWFTEFGHLNVTQFPHPSHRTGLADFPHPALLQHIKPSRSGGYGEYPEGVSVLTARTGAGQDTGDTLFPADLSRS